MGGCLPEPLATVKCPPTPSPLQLLLLWDTPGCTFHSQASSLLLWIALLPASPLEPLLLEAAWWEVFALQTKDKVNGGSSSKALHGCQHHAKLANSREG